MRIAAAGDVLRLRSGLGFLFIEISLIERASLFLNDRTAAFAIVLTAMLVFSGLGSLLADRVGPGGIALSAGVVVLWCVAGAVPGCSR